MRSEKYRRRAKKKRKKQVSIRKRKTIENPFFVCKVEEAISCFWIFVFFQRHCCGVHHQTIKLRKKKLEAGAGGCRGENPRRREGNARRERGKPCQEWRSPQKKKLFKSFEAPRTNFSSQRHFDQLIIFFFGGGVWKNFKILSGSRWELN